MASRSNTIWEGGTGWAWTKNELVVEIAEAGKQDHLKYHLDLTGLYQIKNLITVLEAISQLKNIGLGIDSEAVKTGLLKTKKITGLHGRWEKINDKPLVVLDVCHNEEGFRQCMHQAELQDPHQLHIIIGMVKDKVLDPILQQLPASALYYFTQANIPRALQADQLQKKAELYHLQGEVYQNVNKALSEALRKAHPDDLILICGSVFLVGELTFPVKEIH